MPRTTINSNANMYLLFRYLPVLRYLQIAALRNVNLWNRCPRTSTLLTNVMFSPCFVQHKQVTKEIAAVIDMHHINSRR